MKNHDETSVEIKRKNLQATVALFKEINEVTGNAVPQVMREQALLRRLRLGFLVLYDYLCDRSQLPDEMKQKPFEDSVEYFVAKKCLSEEDKGTFLILGNIYAAISLADPGTGPDTEKVMQEVPKVYDFLQRMAYAPS